MDVEGTLSCTTYVTLINNQVLPFLATVLYNSNEIFQQDNALSDTAWALQEWFQ